MCVRGHVYVCYESCICVLGVIYISVLGVMYMCARGHVYVVRGRVYVC